MTRRSAGRRGDVHLFTKCEHLEGTGRHDRRPQSLERSIARSLARLRTDHIDLLQVHTCSEDDLRRGHVVAILERARECGQARFVGYSGDGRGVRAYPDALARGGRRVLDRAAVSHGGLRGGATRPRA